MSDPLEETISLSDMTEITETEDPRATQYGSTLGTDLSGQANQLEGGKSEPGDTEVRKKTTTLQEKLDAIWTSETPGTGGVRFGPISTTPPGSNPAPPQIPGAPVQNRMCGGSYDQIFIYFSGTVERAAARPYYDKTQRLPHAQSDRDVAHLAMLTARIKGRELDTGVGFSPTECSTKQ